MPESGGDSDTGGNAFPTYGGANPVSLRQAAPSRGRGENVGRFECIYPSFLWKEVPAGRRLGAQSGVKDDVRLSIFLGKHGFNRCQILLLHFYVQRGIGGANSELCKEGYGEAMHKNSCKS